MEQALLALVDAAIAPPVAWGAAKRDSVPPYVVLRRVSSGADTLLDGPAGLQEARVQIDCYGTSYREAVETADAIEAAISGHRGGDIAGVFFESRRDLSVQATLAETGFAHSFDVTVVYR